MSYKQFGWRTREKYEFQYSIIETNGIFELTITKLMKHRYGYKVIGVGQDTFISLALAQQYVKTHI